MVYRQHSCFLNDSDTLYSDDAMTNLLSAILNVFSQFLQEARDLRKRLDEQENEMATLSEQVLKLEEDAVLVKNRIDALKVAETETKAVIAELQTRIADLEGKVPTQDLLDRLDKVDTDLDAAIAAEPTTPTEPNPPTPPAVPESFAPRQRRPS